MDWNTLLSVALGGLIATIGSILSNRFQAQERQKERDEQRREAHIQAKEKWIERDVLRLMDLLDSQMKLIKEEESLDHSQKILEDKHEFGILTEKEYNDAGLAMGIRLAEGIQQINVAWELMARLVYSFQDEDVIEVFEKFQEVSEGWRNLDITVKSTKKDRQRKTKLWQDTILTGGEFHHALREKLISIRDTKQ